MKTLCLYQYICDIHRKAWLQPISASRAFGGIILYCKMPGKVVLNVAEKPSVASDIVRALCPHNHTKTNPASRINAVFEFPYTLQGQEVTMRITSVRGHVFEVDFASGYQQDWTIPPDSLYSAPVERTVREENRDVEDNLRVCSSDVDVLALWLDCDREGEAIAYEVIALVTKYRRNVEIKRAHFSALTQRDIVYALEHLQNPRRELAEAVEARQEVDLRIGASFTRLLTLKLKSKLLGPGALKKVISYGPCQFPTMGFVVKRYLERANFRSSPYWYLEARYEDAQDKADFSWSRGRLYDQETVLALYEDCVEVGRAKVLRVDTKETKKLRPVPLSTVELIKTASKRLRLTSDRTMKLAESLYHSGIISYPRTETDFFKETINLKELIRLQAGNLNWGGYVTRLENGEFQYPRRGTHDDNSHPPIHPVKGVNRADLDPEEWRVYELIARHFLACCSKDALGHSTEVHISIGFEEFHASALTILERNFLDIYPYTTWGEATLPALQPGQVFIPHSLLMKEGQTTPPALLAESQLITMMEKAGIGTDATIPQHIKTIQERDYVQLTKDDRFSPTPVGLALYKAFKEIGLSVTEPELRAKMERGLKAIADGEKRKAEIVGECLEEMYGFYMYTESNIDHMSAICRTVMAQELACPICRETGHIGANCPSVVPAPGRNTAGLVCYRCQQPGHFANACPEAASGARKGQNGVCYVCNQQGHYANVCPMRQGGGEQRGNVAYQKGSGQGKENKGGKGRKRSKKPGKKHG